MLDLSKIKCAQCEMRHRGVFQSLEDDLIKKIDDEKTVRRYSPGQMIYSEGMPCWSLCCIHTGAVKVYKLGERGEVQIIRLLGPTELVGLRPLVSDEPFAATVEALDNTIACVFPRKTIHEVMHQSEKLNLDIMAHLARELRLSEEMLMAMTQRSVTRRAAYLILLLFSRGSTATSTGLSTNMMLKKKEMAQMIGTAPETFSRTLKGFASEGLIALTHRDIQLLDEDKLRALATINGTYT